MELVIVIGIQQVMLAVVLVVEDDLNPSQGGLEALEVLNRIGGAVIPPLTPLQKGLPQLCAF